MIGRLILFACFALLACDRAGAPPLGAVREVRVPAAEGSGEPNLHVDADGRAYLTWIEPDAAGSALRFAVLAGDSFGAPRTIVRDSALFVNWADFPSLIRLPDGRLAAHWLARSGPERYAYDVRVAFSTDDGATWSAPVTPHDDGTPTEHGFVSLFPAAGDRLGVVWLDGRDYARGADDAEMSVRYAEVAPDGAVRDAGMLDARACDCCQTAVALLDDAPVLAYRDRDAAEVRDIAVTRYAGGRWTAPARVHADGWRIEACPVNGPAASAAAGRLAVAWFTAAHDTARVLVAFSSDGAEFTAPVRVDGGAPLGRVDVELLPDGSALVVWLETMGDAAEVRLRAVKPDGTVGAAVVATRTTTARASGFPRAALAGTRLVLAWTDAETERVRVAVAPVRRLD